MKSVIIIAALLTIDLCIAETYHSHQKKDYERDKRASPILYPHLSNVAKLRHRLQLANSYDSFDYQQPSDDFVYQDNIEADYAYYDLSNYDSLREKFPNLKSIILLEQDGNSALKPLDLQRSAFPDIIRHTNAVFRERFPPYSSIDSKGVNLLNRYYRHRSRLPSGQLQSSAILNPYSSYSSITTPNRNPQRNNLKNFRLQKLLNSGRGSTVHSGNVNQDARQKSKKHHHADDFEMNFTVDPSTYPDKNYRVIRVNGEAGLRNLTSIINQFMSTIDVEEDDPVEIVVVVEKDQESTNEDLRKLASNVREHFTSFGNSEHNEETQSANNKLTTSLKKLMLNQIYLLSESLETLKELEENINGDTFPNAQKLVANKKIQGNGHSLNHAEFSTSEDGVINRTIRKKRSTMYETYMHGLHVLENALNKEDVNTIFLLLENLLLDVHNLLKRFATKKIIPFEFKDSTNIQYSPKKEDLVKIKKLKTLLKTIHLQNKNLVTPFNIQTELDNILKLLQAIHLSKLKTKLKLRRKKRNTENKSAEEKILKSLKIPTVRKNIKQKSKANREFSLENFSKKTAKRFPHPKINLVKHDDSASKSTNEIKEQPSNSHVLNDLAFQKRMLNLNKFENFDSNTMTKETWINLINKSSKPPKFTRRMLQIVNTGIESTREKIDTSNEVSSPLNILYEDNDILITEIPDKIIRSSTVEELKSLIKNNGTFVSEIYIVKDGNCRILRTDANGFKEEKCSFKDDELHLIDNTLYIDPQAKIKNLNTQALLNNKVDKPSNENFAESTENVFATKMENSWGMPAASTEVLNDIIKNPLYKKTGTTVSNKNFGPPHTTIITTTKEPEKVLGEPTFSRFRSYTGVNKTDQKGASSDLSNFLTQKDLVTLFGKSQHTSDHHANHGTHHQHDQAMHNDMKHGLNHNHDKSHHHTNEELSSSLLAGIDLLSNVESLIEKLEQQPDGPLTFKNGKATVDGRNIKNISSILPLFNGIQFDTEKEINIEFTVDNNDGTKSLVKFNSNNISATPAPLTMEKINVPGPTPVTIRPIRDTPFNPITNPPVNQQIPQILTLPKTTFPKENLVIVPANFLQNMLNVDFKEYGSKLSDDLIGTNVDSIKHLQKGKKMTKEEGNEKAKDSDFTNQLLKHRNTLLDIISAVEKRNLTLKELLEGKPTNTKEKKEVKEKPTETKVLREKKEIADIIKSKKFIDNVVSTFFEPLIATALNKSTSSANDVIKQINITKTKNSTNGDNLEIFILRYDGDKGIQKIIKEYKNATTKFSLGTRTKKSTGNDYEGDNSEEQNGITFVEVDKESNNDAEVAIDSEDLKNGTNIRVTISINPENQKKNSNTPYEKFYKDYLMGGMNNETMAKYYQNNRFLADRLATQVAYNFGNYRRNHGFNRLGLPSSLTQAGRFRDVKNIDFTSPLRNRKFSSRMQNLNQQDDTLLRLLSAPHINSRLIPHYQFPAVLPLEKGPDSKINIGEAKSKWVWAGKEQGRSSRKTNQDAIEIGQTRLKSLLEELDSFFSKSGENAKLSSREDKWKWKT